MVSAMTETPARILSLAHGKLHLDLAPERGGSIVRFALDGPTGPIMLMRPGTAAGLAEREPRELASFPLFPYSGRIAGGKVRFGPEGVRWPRHGTCAGGGFGASLVLDICSGDGAARPPSAWPEPPPRLEIVAFPPPRPLVIYTPKDRDFFCVEPVSHASGGFALAAAGVADTGTRLLEPGETLAASMRFEPSSLTGYCSDMRHAHPPTPAL